MFASLCAGGGFFEAILPLHSMLVFLESGLDALDACFFDKWGAHDAMLLVLTVLVLAIFSDHAETTASSPESAASF